MGRRPAAKALWIPFANPEGLRGHALASTAWRWPSIVRSNCWRSSDRPAGAFARSDRSHSRSASRSPPGCRWLGGNVFGTAGSESTTQLCKFMCAKPLMLHTVNMKLSQCKNKKYLQQGEKIFICVHGYRYRKLLQAMVFIQVNKILQRHSDNDRGKRRVADNDRHWAAIKKKPRDGSLGAKAH